jgi:hypothetical protein
VAEDVIAVSSMLIALAVPLLILAVLVVLVLWLRKRRSRLAVRDAASPGL